MPKLNLKCPNCQSLKFTHQEKPFVLYAFDKDEKRNPAIKDGVVVKPFLCSECGYIMMFKASMLEGA
ncbi:MAG: hypothetical protein PVG23_06415 [Nitrosopumilaceae archaeon]|jgi:hypothetical protein